MKLRYFIAAFRDLFQVLPTFPRRAWSRVDYVLPSRSTVVLVSGFAATKRNLAVIQRRLERDGFNVLTLSLDWSTLSDGVTGLYRMAEKLSALILSLRKRPGMSRAKIYLVAHSAGGLVARYYVQRLGGDHYCEGLVTLGTPHSGTWAAALGLLTHLVLKARCLFQMLPISGFLKQLNSSCLPTGFPIVSLYSRHDFVCHGRAAKMPERLMKSGEVETIEFRGLSHSDLLLSKRVYSTVLKNLGAEPRTRENQTGS